MENRRIKTPRQLRRQRLAFWTACALLVAYAVLGGDYKLYHLALLGSERDRADRRIEELRAENAVLAERERQLAVDPKVLEGVARNKGMIHPGEIVYRLVPGRPAAEGDSAPRAADPTP